MISILADSIGCKKITGGKHGREQEVFITLSKATDGEELKLEIFGQWLGAAMLEDKH